MKTTRSENSYMTRKQLIAKVLSIADRADDAEKFQILQEALNRLSGHDVFLLLKKVDTMAVAV